MLLLFLAIIASLMIQKGMKQSKTDSGAKELDSAFEGFLKAFAALLGRLREFAVYMALAFRVYVIWPLKKPRRFIHLLVICSFVACGLVSLVEIIHRLNVGRFLRASHLAAVKQFIAEFVDLLNDHVLKTIWVNLFLLLPIEAAVIVRHISEFRNPRDPMFWDVYQKLLLRVNGLRSQLVAIHYGDDSDEAERQRLKNERMGEFLDAVSKVFREAFERSKMKDVCVSIMELNSGYSPELLKIIFANTGEDQNGNPLRDKIDIDFALERGKGASGLALEKNCIVYIPSIKTGHAVLMTEKALWEASGYQLARRVYSPASKEPFKSMICVPIMNGTANPAAVLSISSETRGAFSSVDFMTAWRAALVVSLGLNP